MPARALVRIGLLCLLGLGCACTQRLVPACDAPASGPTRVWSYDGPRVYIVVNTQSTSEGLIRLQQELDALEINARLFEPADLKQIVNDIRHNRDQQIILIGHGHGGHTALQAAWAYAKCPEAKTIRALILLDAIDPSEQKTRGSEKHTSVYFAPPAQQLPANLLYVFNFVQRNSDALHWGYPVICPRGSGRQIATDVSQARFVHDAFEANYELATRQIDHESIDDAPQVMDQVRTLVRKLHADSFAHTPVQHRLR